jgi:hypothetical protein
VASPAPATTAEPPEPETLLHRLGGPGGASAIVAGLHGRVLADPLLRHYVQDVDDDAFDRAAGHLLDVLAAHGLDPALIDDVILRVAALRPLIVGSPHA